MDQAFQAAPPAAPSGQLVAMGVPGTGLPPWLLLVGIGAVCLVLGAVLMVVLR